MWWLENHGTERDGSFRYCTPWSSLMAAGEMGWSRIPYPNRDMGKLDPAQRNMARRRVFSSLCLRRIIDWTGAVQPAHRSQKRNYPKIIGKHHEEVGIGLFWISQWRRLISSFTKYLLRTFSMWSMKHGTGLSGRHNTNSLSSFSLKFLEKDSTGKWDLRGGQL